MTKLTIILLILLSELQYSLWFGKNGIYALIQINADLESQKAFNSKLKARNDQLRYKVQNLHYHLQLMEKQNNNVDQVSKK
ncbi:septum formation initiator family protein [Candidatus Erwinia haradaeae]|uniref:Cell division protein FtsB, partial n=1 Tax=Candidatus Erwinia haradaeae TaxID=1922217 RepID=A0A803FUH6_9GAMM|nr:septum formation initiator family protein [Candidatus Erwinia haradaeae]VFP88791.1 Cell division protein FtsB [Candidatus Erwinia haradaeae]